MRRIPPDLAGSTPAHPHRTRDPIPRSRAALVPLKATADRHRARASRRRDQTRKPGRTNTHHPDIPPPRTPRSPPARTDTARGWKRSPSIRPVSGSHFQAHASTSRIRPPPSPTDECLAVGAIVDDRDRQVTGNSPLGQCSASGSRGHGLVSGRRALVLPEMKHRQLRHAGSAALQNAASRWVTPEFRGNRTNTRPHENGYANDRPRTTQRAMNDQNDGSDRCPQQLPATTPTRPT